MTRAEKLAEAAKLTREVLSTLNEAEHICETCGVKAKENWTEHQIGQELHAVAAKLERFSGKFSAS